MKRYLMVVTLSFGLLGAPAAAPASHCGTLINVASYTARAVSVPWYTMCLLDPSGHDVDWRIINPGAEAIVVQYLVDQGLPSVTATLNGLGFVDRSIVLSRQAVGGLGFVYQSSVHDIPAGPTASGCLHVAVRIDPSDPEDIPITTGFHTLDSSCPDF